MGAPMPEAWLAKRERLPVMMRVLRSRVLYDPLIHGQGASHHAGAPTEPSGAILQSFTAATSRLTPGNALTPGPAEQGLDSARHTCN